MCLDTYRLVPFHELRIPSTVGYSGIEVARQWEMSRGQEHKPQLSIVPQVPARGEMDLAFIN
jgi:hypothetical protein